MKFKSFLTALLIIVTSSLVSWYVTSYYYMNQSASSSEDIISREISLLEKSKNLQPVCEDFNQSNNISITKDTQFIIIWKLDKDINFLEKLVINNEFYTAYEKINNTCK